MIAVSDTWPRILVKLSRVAKDLLAKLKKMTSAISVTSGAMLRNWLRSR